MRFYRALLRLYPSSFRGEYGEEMCAIFAERLREKPGLFAALRLGIEALGDILPNAIRSHGDLLRQDLRYTARTLIGAWGFAATAILVVALGIGATTAAFSITDHVLIRPLPFPRSQDLIALWENQPHRDISRNELSPGNFRDWKRLATSFESMGACSTSSTNLVGAGSPERLDTALVTWDLFPTLGIGASVGRIFTAEDDCPGSARSRHSVRSAVEVALRGGSGRSGTQADLERRPVRGHRGNAQVVPLSGARNGALDDLPVRGRSVHRSDRHVSPCRRTVEARRLARARPRRDAGRRQGSRARASEGERPHGRDGGSPARRVFAAIASAADRALRGFARCPSDRMHESREPAPRPGDRAAARVRGASRARGGPRTRGATARDREPRSRGRGRRVSAWVWLWRRDR